MLSHFSLIQFFDSMDCSPPGSSVCGIPQARILEWVAISFSRRSSQPGDQTWVSCIAGRCFTTRATREAKKIQFSSVQFSCSAVSDSLRPYELQHPSPPCPSPTPGVYSNSCLLSRCMWFTDPISHLSRSQDWGWDYLEVSESNDEDSPDIHWK